MYYCMGFMVLMISPVYGMLFNIQKRLTKLEVKSGCKEK